MYSKFTSKLCALLACILLAGSIWFPASGQAHFRHKENININNLPQSYRDRLEGQPYWREGYLDITKQPYNAKGDGITDDSDAIQQAINDAFFGNFAVYFPSGTYLVTRQLVATQYHDALTNGANSAGASQRKFGNSLIGATTGPKPVIKLQDHSTVVSSPSSVNNPILDTVISLPAYPANNNILLVFQYVTNANPPAVLPASLYAELFRGIDIDLGNNPNVSGISMAGAQFSSIEDVHVYGESFNAGLASLPGSGGGTVNVKVTGGRVGIMQNEYRPQPTVTGVELVNQSEYGIKLLNTRGPLIVSGFRIVGPDQPSPAYRAIYAENTGIGKFNDGANANMTLVDGSIEVAGACGTAIGNFAQDFTMDHVYVKADTIIESGLDAGPATHTVAGSKDDWMRIDNYYFASHLDKGIMQIEGIEYANKAEDVQRYSPPVAEEPPGDLIARHIWDDMPAWNPQSDDLISITEFGATPDDASDNDAVAIQAAIDSVTTAGSPNYGKTVFIPRGHFHVTTGITLKKDLRMIGALNGTSVIHATEGYQLNGHSILVDTVDDPEGRLKLSDFAIIGPMPSAGKGLAAFKELSFLRMRSGDSTLRNIQIDHLENWTSDSHYKVPVIIFTGNAGGKMYGVVQQDTTHNTTGGNMNFDHTSVLIEGTHQPLHFYQYDLEHTNVSYQSVIRNASHVYMYGLKMEYGDGLLLIKDSDDIRIYGAAGNYGLHNRNDDAIITVENSSNIYIVNLNRKGEEGERENSLWLRNGHQAILDDYAVVVYKMTDAIPLQDGANMLQNAGFESGVAGWSGKGSALLAEENVHVNKGQKSVYVSGRNGVSDGPAQSIKEALISSGQGVYDLEAWVKNMSSAATEVSAVVKLTDSQGDKFYRVGNQIGDSLWNKLSGAVYLSWSGELTAAELYVEHSNPVAGYYADRFRMSKSANAVLKTERLRFAKNGANSEDLDIAFELNGNTVAGISLGKYTTAPHWLELGRDYAVNGGTVTLFKDFLLQYEIGDLDLVALFDRGKPLVLPVRITPPGAAATPLTTVFDKKSELQTDIQIELQANGNPLKGIHVGSIPLVEGESYTKQGDIYTISKSVLAIQPVGSLTITFSFNAVDDVQVEIQVVDTTPNGVNSQLTAASTDYYTNFAMLPDMRFDVEWKGNTLNGIYNGGRKLPDHAYEADAAGVRIKGDYLSGQPEGSLFLTFDFSTGADPMIELQVISNNLLSNPDFENGTTDWRKFDNNMKIETISNQPQNGKAALRVSNRQFFYQYPYQIITDALQSLGKRDYYVSAWARNATEPPSQMEITWRLDSDLGSKYLSVIQNNVGTEWAQIKGKMVAADTNWSGPLTNAWMYVRNHTGNAVYDIDNLRLYADGEIGIREAVYAKAAEADLEVPVTFNGNRLLAVRNGSAALTANADYSVSGNKVILSHAYLSAISEELIELVFDFEEGADPVLRIALETLEDRNLLVNGGFEQGTEGWTANGVTMSTTAVGAREGLNALYVTKQAGAWRVPEQNVAAILNEYGKVTYNVSAWVKNESAASDIGVKLFIKSAGYPSEKAVEVKAANVGTDWTYINGQVTLDDQRWSGQLTSARLTITNYADHAKFFVDDVRFETVPGNSLISPTAAVFDKKVAQQSDIQVELSLNGNQLKAIRQGITPLVQGQDYSMAGNIVTIKSAYLASLAVGPVELSFDFNTGDDPVLNISITDSSQSSTISPAAAGFDKEPELQADVAVELALHGNTLIDIRNGTNSLNRGTDYTIDGSTVLIKKEYLAGMPEGITNLSFVFDSGAPATLQLTITRSVPLGPNLLVNGGFENGTEGWTANGVAMSVSDSVYHTGSHGLYVTNKTANWMAPQQNIRPILDKHGKTTYYVSAWVRNESITANIAIKWFLLSTGYGAEKAVEVLQANVGTEWTQISGKIVIDDVRWKDELTSARLTITSYANANANFYVDDISVQVETEEVTPTPTPTPEEPTPTPTPEEPTPTPTPEEPTPTPTPEEPTPTPTPEEPTPTPTPEEPTPTPTPTPEEPTPTPTPEEPTPMPTPEAPTPAPSPAAWELHEHEQKATLRIPAKEGAGQYKASISKDEASLLANLKTVEIQTELAELKMNGGALSSIVSGRTVDLVVAREKKAGLSPAGKSILGDRPALSLTFQNPDGSRIDPSVQLQAKVSILYRPSPGEKPEHILVYRINGQGEAAVVPSGKYDASTGKVSFTADLPGEYAVGYQVKTFGDLSVTDWAKTAVEALASRGIINGTSESGFQPSAQVTRADFLMLLMQTLGLSAAADDNFDDVHKGDYYYGAIATARKLGISEGDGGLFHPEQFITRQDMMTMMSRSMALVPLVAREAAPDRSLAEFSDAGDIDSYARGAASELVKRGMIQGSGGYLLPKGQATRAEAAVMLYRVFQQMD